MLRRYSCGGPSYRRFGRHLAAHVAAAAKKVDAGGVGLAGGNEGAADDDVGEEGRPVPAQRHDSGDGQLPTEAD